MGELPPRNPSPDPAGAEMIEMVEIIRVEHPVIPEPEPSTSRPYRSGMFINRDVPVSKFRPIPRNTIKSCIREPGSPNPRKTVSFQLPAVTLYSSPVECEPQAHCSSSIPMNNQERVLGPIPEFPESGPEGQEPEESPTGSERRKYEYFDSIMEIVGMHGSYQQRVIRWFILPLSFLTPFLTLDIMFSLHVQDHWCGPQNLSRVPYDHIRNLWKQQHIPLVNDSNGNLEFAKCSIYEENTTEIIDCPHGWEYNNTYFATTIASDYNFVCERAHVPDTAKMWAALGAITGALVFGIMADLIGRKMSLILIYGINFLAHVLVIRFAQYVEMLYFSMFLCGTIHPVLLLVPLVIPLELSSGRLRARQIMNAAYLLYIGTVCITGIYYLTAEWYYTLLTMATFALANVVLLITVLESPRWLHANGHDAKTAVILMKVADGNDTSDMLSKAFLVETLRFIRARKRKKYGDQFIRCAKFFRLFTEFGSARNVFALLVTWAINGILYQTLTDKMPALTPRYFSNFIGVYSTDLTAPILAFYLAEKMGRRKAKFTTYLVSVIIISTAGTMWYFEEPSGFFIGLAKSLVASAILVSILQSAEIFPTQVRLTGMGLCTAIYLLFMFLASSMRYLTMDNSIPFAIMSILGLFAALASYYIGETGNIPLADIIEDAYEIAVDTWDYTPPPPPTVSKLFKGVCVEDTLDRINDAYEILPSDLEPEDEETSV